MNEDITVAIHENKGSDRVMKFVKLNDFTRGFKKRYNNGEIWGCYYNKNGNIVAQDNQGQVFYKVISKR